MFNTAPAGITIYSTPTCPWCSRAKDFFRKEGVPFTEHDVSADRAAADQMMRRTRQTGVPVIADEQEAIVGFDVPRLQRMAARHKKPGLGVSVADVRGGVGAYVGAVRTGSISARAGLEVGDVVEEMSGVPIKSAADLETIAQRRAQGQPTSLLLRRAGERRTIILPPA